MEPKPAGWGAAYAAAFGDEDVVEVYGLRPPYPQETIDAIARLADGGAVVDAGCGTGELARRLAGLVARVDAVDVSAAMLAKARTLPGAAAPNLRWVLGPIEEAPLAPPYALAVAGDSVHWFEWESAMPRFAELLAGGGLLTIVHRDWMRDELARERLRAVYVRHSWNADFAPLDPVEELERRGLFTRVGKAVSAPVSWQPTLEELVDGHFSMSGFARSRLTDPDRFADEVRDAIEATLTPVNGRYELDVVGTVVWGRP
jgi:SAM-dependent methyltransferase